MEEYNGYINWETWNVSLWIQNDEGLYNLARLYHRRGFKAFAEFLKEIGTVETPDGASYSFKDLDIQALDDVLRDL